MNPRPTLAEIQAEGHRRGAEQRAKQGLPPLITDPTILRLVAEALATATTPASHGPATVVEAGAIGAARASSGSGGTSRPTNGRKRAVAAARFQDNAG